MVWGGISTAGKTELVVIDGNLSAQRYRDEILQPTAVPYLRNMGNDAVLQDDNARPHRARLVRNFLERERERGYYANGVACVQPRPKPHRASLGSTRPVCAGERVTNETTLAGLRQILIEEWNAIPQQRTRKLMNSMRSRCRAIVQALGSSTCYCALTMSIVEIKDLSL